jgi:dipeptidyl aminopeptidase/acylaminoacyl peptidase
MLLVDLPIGALDIPGNPGAEAAAAIVPQVYRAGELGYIDITRVAVIGQSGGGYTSAAIVANTSLFKAAVAISGFYDLAGWYQPWSIIHRRMGGGPWPDASRFVANSPYYRAADIVTPLLLIHGEADDACPVDEARKLFTALKTAGKTVQLATYAGEGHVPLEWALPNATDAMQRIFAFLDRHLRATSEPEPSLP